MIVAPSMVFVTGGIELTSLALMARVTRSVSSLMGMFEWNLGPSSTDGSVEPSCGIPLLLNSPLGRCLSHLIGSGGPLASPQWRFCGLGSRLGLNEKIEMTLSASKQVG